MSLNKRIVIITGTNRGLGKAIVQYLAHSNESSLYHIIMTGRNTKAVEEAKQDILSTLSNKKDICTIDVKQLDISQTQSRKEFCHWFANNYSKLDVLFNNAGVVNKELDDYSFQKKPDYENTKWTFETNVFGTIDITNGLLPYLSQDAKVLMMSSNLGLLKYQGIEGQKFLANPTLTLEELKMAADKYIKNATYNDTAYFCNSPYHTSKAILNAYCRMVAPKILSPNQSMYAISPGWVKTDMGGEFAEETIEQSGPFLSDLITKLPFGRNPLSFKFIEKMKEIEY